MSSAAEIGRFEAGAVRRRELRPGVARHTAVLSALALILAVHIEIGTNLGLARQWGLISGSSPETFEEVQFLFATLPRSVMAVLVGAGLGLVGSVLQQATQNRLISPLTMGASSGAWLALVIATISFPELAATHGEWFSMTGALLATALVVLIAGRFGIGGVRIVLAGMAVNILFGAMAHGFLLLNQERTQGLFVWGAGDLTQTDWSWVMWLLPKLLVGLLLLALAPRPLMLLRLGHEGAASRGLPLWPVLLLLLVGCLWIAASIVTAVGIIGFIALLAPNIAMWLGARRSLDEMLSSAFIGAGLLVGTDCIALGVGQFTADIVPSGASAALIGAPALILLLRRTIKAQDHASFRMIEGRARAGSRPVAAAAIILLALATISLTLARSLEGWTISVSDPLLLSIRWPRIVMAMAAGAGMAVAGVILQRLIRNPLASPDILGMSQGATLALVVSAVLFETSFLDGEGLVALAGSLAVLVLLLGLGRRHGYSAGIMALIGISISAVMDALVQFVLSSGSDKAFAILNWLGGSTYRAAADEAVILLCVVGLILTGMLLLHRWLELLSAGDDIAAARGLPVGPARITLLGFAASLTAAVTVAMGPIAFVGLLSPHMAAALGVRGARTQLVMAALIGACLMLVSDWAGRMLLYPTQLSAGVIASVLGGVYFVLLLLRARSAR